MFFLLAAFFGAQSPLKRLGGGGGVGQVDLPMVFLKKKFFRESVKPWFFVAFNVMIRHAFIENYISSSFSKDIKNLFLNIKYFYY